MIPPFQKYLYPFLCLMGDGKVRNISQVSDDLGKSMKNLLKHMKQAVRTDIMAAVAGLAPGF